MRFFLIFIIFCLVAPLSFAQSQRFNTNLYSNYLKGLFAAQKGQSEKALENLEQVKVKDPKSIHIRLKIATVYIRMGLMDKAEEVLKEAKKFDPNNLDISLALIFVYSYAQKEYELENEYEHFLKKAHEVKPKDESISEYLAQFYFYKKRPQDAIAIYETILETNPEYVEALFWLGYLYEETGRHDDAVKTWVKGLKVEPDYAPMLNSLAYTYAVDGVKLKNAEAMAKKALEIEPNNGAYLDTLGWIYFKKKDFKKAENYLLQAIDHIKDPDIYEHLGDLYLKLDDDVKAFNYYKEGLTRFPDSKNLKIKVNDHGSKNKDN